MKKTVGNRFPVYSPRKLCLLVSAVVVLSLLMTAGSPGATEAEKDPQKTLPPPTIEGPSAPMEVEMAMIGELSSRQPFVTLSLNGTRSERFLLDSGASEIYLTRKTAEKLQLKPIGTTQVRGFGDLGIHQEEVVLLESLVLGEMKIKNVPAAVMLNLPWNFGVLGLPILGKAAAVELDFKRKRLRILPYGPAAQEDQKTEPAKLSLPFRNLGGKIVIEILINDRPCNAVVDTGAYGTILFQPALEEIKGLTVIPRGAYYRGHARTGGLSGLTGDFYVVKGVRISFAGHELSRPVVHNGEEIRAYKMDFFQSSDVKIHALLGMSHLSHFKLKINYRDSLLTFEVPK